MENYCILRQFMKNIAMKIFRVTFVKFVFLTLNAKHGI